MWTNLVLSFYYIAFNITYAINAKLHGLRNINLGRKYFPSKCFVLSKEIFPEKGVRKYFY
jgi:hypothetical protein